MILTLAKFLAKRLIMKRYKQTIIAQLVGITDAFFSEILAGKKNPSWKTAKKLAGVLPWTTPSFWMESTADERRNALIIREVA